MTLADRRVLVIGYGNTLRGDDGLGWYAADYLARTVQSDTIKVITCHQLTVELAGPVSEADLVILIDSRAGEIPGVLACEEVQIDLDLPPGAVFHYVTPSALLGCVLALYDSAPQTLLVTVTGSSFGYEEGLSPVVQQVMVELIAHLEAFFRHDPDGQILFTLPKNVVA